MIRRVLSMILLVAMGTLTSGCFTAVLSSNRGGGGWYNQHGYFGHNRYHGDRVVVVPVEKRDPNIKVEREPGLVDVPLGILGYGLGLVFGRTKLVDTSCPDEDISCHRAKGRAEARHDAKSAVADATEDAAYREAYNEAIRSSGQPVEAEPEGE